MTTPSESFNNAVIRSQEYTLGEGTDFDSQISTRVETSVRPVVLPAGTHIVPRSIINRGIRAVVLPAGTPIRPRSSGNFPRREGEVRTPATSDRTLTTDGRAPSRVRPVVLSANP